MLWEGKGTLPSLERAVAFQFQPIPTMGNGGSEAPAVFIFQEKLYMGFGNLFFKSVFENTVDPHSVISCLHGPGCQHKMEKVRLKNRYLNSSIPCPPT